MKVRLGVLCLVVVSFVVPVFSWQQNTGGLERLFDIHEPPGQSWYVLSRLFGVLALCAGCWQFVLGLSVKFPVRLLTSRVMQMRLHAAIGLATFSLFWAHALCFVSAVSIRKDRIAYNLLLPDIADYYHSVITVGWLALVLITIAVMARVFRIKNQHLWHRLVYVVLPFATVHSYLIGSDTRDPLMLVFYLILFVVWVGAILFAFGPRRLGETLPAA